MLLLRPAVVAEQRFRLYGTVAVPCRVPYVLAASCIGGLLLAVGYFAFVTDYTEREAVRGYLMPVQGIAHVRAPRGGIVDRVFVGFGARVHKGEPIVRMTSEARLDSGATLGVAVMENLERRRGELDAQAELATTQLEQTMAAVRHERERLRAEIAVVDAQIAAQQQWLVSTTERVEAYRRAAATGSVPALEIKRLEAELMNGEVQRRTLERQRIALGGEVERTIERERDLRREHRATLSTIELRRVDLEDMALDNDRANAQVVVAPMDGVVVSHSALEGAEVATGKELFVIAPPGAALVAQVFAPVSAVGFVAPGQQVSIQYDSFPHQDFGTFSGTVLEIAEFVFDRHELEVELSISQPVFRVLVALDRHTVSVNGAEVALKPGMTFDAHIATRTMSVADWVLEPLMSLRDAPLHRRT
jgi:membrane fusion protein